MAAEALVVLFFLALAAFATRPILLAPATTTLAGGDPLVDLWTVDWLAENFFRPASLFHGNTFHPAPHAVLYSDLSLGTVVLVLPLRLLGADPVVLYNAALLAGFAFAGWAWSRLGLAVSGSRAGGLLCGTLAAFASHQLFHVYHLNLVSTGWLALFLLALWRIREQPTAGRVVLAGVSFALSAQTSGYYAVAGVLLALILAAVEARRLADRRVLAAYLGAALLAGVLLAPYLQASLELRRGQSFRRPVGMSASMAFVPARDLGSQGYVYGAILGRGGERLFPGLLLPVLALVALRRRRDLRYFGIAAALLVVLSLGPHLDVGGAQVPLPYAALHALPLFESMRHPYTFAAVALFLLAVLAAAGWSSLAIATRRGAGAAAVALAVIETAAPGPALQQVPPGLPAHYAVLDHLPPGPVLEVPLLSDDVLVWAARHGRPMLNGQGSAFVPLDTLRLNRYIQNHWVKRTPADVDASKPAQFLVQRFPVRYVVLPGSKMRQLGPLAAALDGSRTFARVGEASDGGLVYEVRRDQAPAAAPIADDDPE